MVEIDSGERNGEYIVTTEIPYGLCEIIGSLRDSWDSLPKGEERVLGLPLGLEHRKERYQGGFPLGRQARERTRRCVVYRGGHHARAAVGLFRSRLDQRRELGRMAEARCEMMPMTARVVAAAVPDPATGLRGPFRGGPEVFRVTYGS